MNILRMKRISNIFQKIANSNNVFYADEKARKGKKNSFGVRNHDRNKEENLNKLLSDIENLTYKTSKYDIFKIYEPKEREIYRLPYYPDRITHHAIMNVLESIWEKIFYSHSYACRKNFGIHKAVRDIKKVLHRDKIGTTYCLKMDIRKFYPSIDHQILKQIIRKKIKDKKVLCLLDEIIDSAPGVPIGNYLSQYFANLYLTYFDHWLKEVKHVKYYFRYADDLVIFGKDKLSLHKLRIETNEYLNNNLKLSLKDNYQVFPIENRGVDFVGYVFRYTHVKLRKSIKKKMLLTLHKLNKHKRSREYVRKKLCAYSGWLKHCNSIHFVNKHVYSLCSCYHLPTPEIINCKQTIVSNLCNKTIFVLDYKCYDKYFKVYILLKNVICYFISQSNTLFDIVLHTKMNFIKLNKYKNKYII